MSSEQKIASGTGTISNPPTVLLTKNIELVLRDENQTILPAGTYDRNTLVEVLKKTNPQIQPSAQMQPSLFILPGTSVSVVYYDGTQKKFSSPPKGPAQDSIVMLNTSNIKSFTTSNIDTNEHFTINSSGISSSWVEIMVMILIIVLLYYYWGRIA